MDKHPIGDLMETTMQKIKEMVDVNTIVGAPITTADGITLIPVSKVSFGFASGGSDFQSKHQQPGRNNSFGGGSGAGVSIVPVAFVVVKGGTVKMLSIAPEETSTVSKVIDMVPDVFEKLSDFIGKTKADKEDEEQSDEEQA